MLHDVQFHRALNASNRYTRVVAEARMKWLREARPKQLPPAGNWLVWNIMAGRGNGKTRTGAEDTWYNAASLPRTRWAVIAPTQNDVRSVCFEGESGLLNRLPQGIIKSYSSTDLEILLNNGSLIAGKSAEKPDRLRGPQWHGGWCDELAAWGASSAGVGGTKKNGEAKRLQDTWDNYLFGLRLGERPRTLVTTTPRPLDFLRKLVKDPTVFTTTGSTFENSKNLAASALETFRRIYEGTRRGEQELYAKILDTNEHALWKAAQLEACRVDEVPPGVDLMCIVIAIDPAVTTEEQSDETGIIIAGVGDDGVIYILGDLSGKYAPRAWAREALVAYDRMSADAIIGETNQGGDLVEANLEAYAVAEGQTFAFRGVHAKRGKYLRAEPVAAYYEKGKVRHVGHFPQLEAQMCNFTGSTGAGSPDRLDALVYAVSDLIRRTSPHAFW